jgi:hypothetical protein
MKNFKCGVANRTTIIKETYSEITGQGTAEVVDRVVETRECAFEKECFARDPQFQCPLFLTD